MKHAAIVGFLLLLLLDYSCVSIMCIIQKWAIMLSILIIFNNVLLSSKAHRCDSIFVLIYKDSHEIRSSWESNDCQAITRSPPGKHNNNKKKSLLLLFANRHHNEIVEQNIHNTMSASPMARQLSGMGIPTRWVSHCHHAFTNLFLGERVRLCCLFNNKIFFYAVSKVVCKSHLITLKCRASEKKTLRQNNMGVENRTFKNYLLLFMFFKCRWTF